MRKSLWSVVRAQHFEQSCRLVRDGIHQTLSVLFHVVFSLEQSKKLKLRYSPVQITMYSPDKVFKLPELCNLLLDLAQYALRKANKMAIGLRHFSRPFSSFSVFEFAPKMAKIDNLFMTKTAENSFLWGGIYLYKRSTPWKKMVISITENSF